MSVAQNGNKKANIGFNTCHFDKRKKMGLGIRVVVATGQTLVLNVLSTEENSFPKHLNSNWPLYEGGNHRASNLKQKRKVPFFVLMFYCI